MGITNQTPRPLNRTTSLCVACSPATPDGLPPSSPPRRTLTPSCHPPVTRPSSSGSSPARTPSTASLSCTHRPLALRPGCQDLLGWPLRPLRLMGRHPASLGHLHRPHHPSLRRPLQGRPVRCFLRRQPSDRVCFP